MEKEKTAHSIKILMVEDNKSDAMLIQEMLYEAADTKREDFHYELISKGRLVDATDYLGKNKVDVILLDLSLPDSSSSNTVRKILDQENNTPVIVLTGLDDETTTMQALQNGAQDYLNKNQIDSILLARSIKYAIERFNNVREKERLIKELKEALDNVKTLSGLLPICANCKDIRTDDGYWIQLESYFKTRSNLKFTHGICPNCLKKLYPDLYNKKIPSEGG